MSQNSYRFAIQILRKFLVETNSIGLKYSTGLKKIQYRMKPQGVSINEMQSGDMRSYKNTKNIFVCKYVV